MEEQNITITTFVKLDIVDRIKVLFGRCLKIEIKVIVPQKEEITRFNVVSNTEIIKSTGIFIKQNRPPFGYVSSN